MDTTLKIGFIGVGTIARAVILALVKVPHPFFQKIKIFVSSHDRSLAELLVKNYGNIELLSSNQAVIEASDKIFLCVPSQVAQNVLEDLSFKTHQSLISFVAMATKVQLEQWTKNIPKIYRAVPLPFIEDRKGVTPFYPQDEFLEHFFEPLGGALALEREELLALFLLGGSMMGIYYHFLSHCEKILIKEGLSYDKAHQYLISMFGHLCDVMRQDGAKDLETLARDYSTPNGTNALLAEIFAQQGGFKALEEAASKTLEVIVKP